MLKLFNKLSLKYLRRNNRNVVPFFIFDYMECKNCLNNIPEKANFCNNCGAKVIVNRITFKALLIDVFINVFGFDSKFFLTLRTVARQPHIVVSEVLGGVRKRYMNPFAFLAVGAAISLIVFNYFDDEFRAVNTEVNSEQIAEIKKQANMDIDAIEGLSQKEIQGLEMQKKIAQANLSFMEGYMNFTIQYYNLFAFFFLVLYAVLSKWTFWKPHNFGEHIVINAYIFGFTIYLSLILFFLSIVIHPSIYVYSMVLYILFYMYAFGKLYKLSIWKNILKLLRFILGLVMLLIVIILIGAAISIVLGVLGVIKF